MSEFKITGPGKYRMRNGEVAIITACDFDDPRGYRFKGDRPATKETECLWNQNGYAYRGEEYNIIDGPIAQPEEMAGLDGFVGVYDYKGDGDPTSVHGTWSRKYVPNTQPDRPENLLLHVIDLSLVPRSAIVKPKPKRVRGWVNVGYGHHDTFEMDGVYKTKFDADKAVQRKRFDRIACIEVDFAEGDGLL